MAETQTVNYHWTMPDPGGSANTWGATLNATTQKIDAALWTISANSATFAGGVNINGGLFVSAGGATINGGLVSGGALTASGLTSTNGSIASQAPSGGNAYFMMANSAGTQMGLLYWDPTNQVVLVNQTGGGYLVINPDGSVTTSGAFFTQALSATNATFSAVTVNGNEVVSGALTVGGVTNTGTLAATGNISTTGRIISGGTVQAIGYQCRQGITGGFSGNAFNAFYVSGTGHTQWYIDGAYQGDLAYQAPSDYRIKQNVTALPSMWDRVKALRPISYTHKEYTPLKTPKDNGKEHWGFIAHELQEALIDDAASGVKDQVDSLQSPNPWTVIATLTKALQEAMARVEALEARL